MKIISAVAIVVATFLLVTNPVVVDAAGQITGKQIKNNSIAGKDIKKNTLTGANVKDDSLTGADVNEATLAGVNATTLNGQPASAYQTTGYKFTLPVTAASTTKTFNLAVPAGTYHATYNVIATGATPRCRFYPDGTSAVGIGWQDGLSSGGVFFASSSAILTVPAGQTPRLVCSGAAFALYGGGDGPSTANLVRVDTINNVNATGGREARPGGPLG
jgi:hypothetical protein